MKSCKYFIDGVFLQYFQYLRFIFVSKHGFEAPDTTNYKQVKLPMFNSSHTNQEYLENLTRCIIDKRTILTRFTVYQKVILNDNMHFKLTGNEAFRWVVTGLEN